MKLFDDTKGLIRDIAVNILAAVIPVVIFGVLARRENESLLPNLFVIVLMVLFVLLIAVSNWRARQIHTREFILSKKNEVEASPLLKSQMEKTKRDLFVISKVGAAILTVQESFREDAIVMFDEYVNLLKRGVNIKILMNDPSDPGIMEPLDRFFASDDTRIGWIDYKEKLINGLTLLAKKKRVSSDEFDEIYALMVDAKGHKELIEASVMLWKIAEARAVSQFTSIQKESGQKGLKCGKLEILYSGEIPEKKAWLSDISEIRVKGRKSGKETAITRYTGSAVGGNYDFKHYGRDLPLYYYHVKSRKDDSEQAANFNDLVKIWYSRTDPQNPWLRMENR